MHKDDAGFENVVKARKMHIRQDDLNASGYTPGCKKCQSILGLGKGKTSTAHSKTWRARIMAEMAKTDEGIVRLARMSERVDRYVANGLTKETNMLRRGIASNAPHAVPLPEFVP